MQNKANFRKSQMNVISALTNDYENIANWTLGENKPNSKPIKPNLVRLRRIQKGLNMRNKKSRFGRRLFR